MDNNNDLLMLQIHLKKIEGTEHDYELVTTLDESFKALSAGAQKAINEITTEYVNTVKQVIKIDRISKKINEKCDD